MEPSAQYPGRVENGDRCTRWVRTESNEGNVRSSASNIIMVVTVNAPFGSEDAERLFCFVIRAPSIHPLRQTPPVPRSLRCEAHGSDVLSCRGPRKCRDTSESVSCQF